MDKIIKKVVLDIDGVEITLTVEQARKLHDALGALLGVKPDNTLEQLKKAMDEVKKDRGRERPVPYPVPYPVPQPIPVYPKPWREPYWYYDSPRITCGDLPVLYKSGTVTMSLSNKAGA